MTDTSILTLALAALEDDREESGPWVVFDSTPDIVFAKLDDGSAHPVLVDHDIGRELIARIAERRNREPKLAKWIERVLGYNGLRSDHRVNVHERAIIVSDHAPKMDGSHVRMTVSPMQARALAAALLRAADEAEGR